MGIDASIPMSVRAPNLAELADAFMMAKKFKSDQESVALDRKAKSMDMGFNLAQEDRAKRGEARAQSTFDQQLTDLATQRKEKRRATLHGLLGGEAEALSSLPPEKRATYYKKHLLPGLKDEGFDVSVINHWRQLAMTPDQRSTERIAGVKADAAANKVDPQLKVDEHGSYVPVNPKTGLNAVTGQPVKAAPQTFMAPGEGGFYTVTVPRGGTGTATPVPIGPGGKQLAPEQKPIPDSVKEAVRTNESQKRVVMNIMGQLAKLPKDYSPTSPGKQAAREYLPFGNAIVDAADPQGMNVRQLIGQLSSLKIKDVSGAAVTASEFPRLAQWIPQVGDTKEQLTSKLQNFQRELDAINSEMGQQYGQGSGYRPDPILSREQPTSGTKPWQRRW
jgi:hypothetical protein